MAASWINSAVKHPGALTRKAKAAGESTQEFAQKHKHSKGTTGKQARLAITLKAIHHHSKDVAKKLYGEKK